MNRAGIRILPYVALLFPLDCAVSAALLLAQAAAIPLRAFARRPPPLPPPDTSRVTIQILNWDGKHLLEEFLPSVLAAAGRHEVMVVDNGSADSSVEMVRRKYPQVRVVELDRNYGFSIGNNLGVRHVSTDIVVFLNNDMAVDPAFLEGLLHPFSDPGVFAVASRIALEDAEKAQQETGKTRGRFEDGFFYLWHDPVPAGDKRLQPVFWAGGGACALDRRKYGMVGGFDRLYHPFYVEDADLSYQAWKRGWTSLLAPSSRVIHRHRGTSRRKFGDDFVDNTTRRNLYLFVWKNVTDFRMLLSHLVHLPSIHGRVMVQRGARFELRAYVRAVLRLPFALLRRLANVPAYTQTDRQVLRSQWDGAKGTRG